jgi:hypothetical protein
MEAEMTEKKKVFTDKDEVNAMLDQLRALHEAGKCILTTNETVSSILPGWAVVINKIVPNPEIDTSFIPGGKIYSASFLRKFAHVAGIEKKSSQRLDGNNHPHIRSFSVTVQGKDLRGSERHAIGISDLDLSDGAVRADVSNDKKKKALQIKRTNITTVAETGAFCRAVCDFAGIRRQVKNGVVPWFVPTLELHAESMPQAMKEALSLAAMQAKMGVFGVLPTVPQERAPAPFVKEEYSTDEQVEYCTDEQVEELTSIGLTNEILTQMGWDGEGPVPLHVYHDSVAEFGGAS